MNNEKLNKDAMKNINGGKKSDPFHRVRGVIGGIDDTNPDVNALLAQGGQIPTPSNDIEVKPKGQQIRV